MEDIVGVNRIVAKIKRWVTSAIATHTAISAAHHIPYIDSDAVTAVATDDAYVKNNGDRMTGDFEMWTRLKTDKYLESNTNLFLGVDIGGLGNLAHTAGYEGWYNIGIGTESLFKIEKGHHLVAIGYRSLYSNTTGRDNMGIGSQTLYYNTTGEYNVAIGTNSLLHNNATFNVAVGNTALYTNTTGQYNVGVGSQTLYYNTTGYQNVAIGINSVLRNTVGVRNTGVGGYALQNNQQGNNNVGIGYESGKGTALHNKSGGVFIGYKAGRDENTSNKLYIHNSESTTPLIYGEFDNTIIKINGYLFITSVKLGATQGAAGAAANEVWKTSGHATLPDNVLMIGV